LILRSLRTSRASVSGSLLADATSAARLRSWIIILGVLVIAAFVGSSAYHLWRSYHEAIAATHRELGNMAKTLAEQAEGSLRLVDLLPMPSLRAQRVIAALVIVTQGGIAVTGAIVRVTASGLGCPTWPQCFPGSFTPVAVSEVPKGARV